MRVVPLFFGEMTLSPSSCLDFAELRPLKIYLFASLWEAAAVSRSSLFMARSSARKMLKSLFGLFSLIASLHSSRHRFSSCAVIVFAPPFPPVFERQFRRLLSLLRATLNRQISSGLFLRQLAAFLDATPYLCSIVVRMVTAWRRTLARFESHFTVGAGDRARFDSP